MCYYDDDDEMEVRDFIRKNPTCVCDGCGKVHNTSDMCICCAPGAGIVLVLCKKCNNEE